MSRLTIRVRLTLVFALAMAAVIAAMGSFLYLRLQSSLTDSLQATLRSQLQEVVHRSGERPDLLDRDSSALAQLLLADGTVVQSSPRTTVPLLSGPQLARVVAGGRVDRAGALPGLRGDWRILAAPAAGGRVAVVAASQRPIQSALDHLLTQLLLAGPAAILLAALGGYALAAGALRPVEAMRRHAEQISATTPSKRLPVPETGDEIARLGRTLNDMLARIDEALEHERRFVADASHELRTPLALLRTEIELALRRPRSAKELEGALRSAAVETDRLSRLADDLLLIARSDQGALPIRREPLRVTDVLHTVAERFAPAAAQSQRRIEVRSPNGLSVDADRLRVEQALSNLVHNALEHGSGTVRLAADVEDEAVELHVTDEGAGFPDAFVGRAFDRFSRADEARGSGGSGLGLAIVQLVASAHGGAVGARTTATGADVWLAIPLSPASHQAPVGSATWAESA